MYFYFDFFLFLEFGPHSLDFYFSLGFFCEFVDLEIFNLVLQLMVF